MAYDAFISYSHAADGRLAPALQSGLQRLAKPWYRLRALRVFRDETSLSTNPQLWSSIEAALDESDWFVFLASPDSARSPWVDKEIAHWLATKPADRILSVLTSGAWEWDTGAGHAVLLAAGGQVIGMDGKPLPYNSKDSLLNPHFIAYADASRDWRSYL